MAAIRNKKRVFYSSTLSEVGRALIGKREDIEAVAFPAPLSGPDFVKLIGAGGETHGAILGGTRFGEAECEAAKGLQVIARIGVGFDAIDVPALTRRKVPLMTVGIANSPSVAEQAVFFMLQLAKRGTELNALVQDGKWAGRMAVPINAWGPRNFYGSIAVFAAPQFGWRNFPAWLGLSVATVLLVAWPRQADSSVSLGRWLIPLRPRTDPFAPVHCPLLAVRCQQAPLPPRG